MKQLKFDFNNMFSFNIGRSHGVSEADLRKTAAAVAKAQRHLKKVLADKASRIKLGLEWTALPWQDSQAITAIQKIGAEIARKSENVIFLGIGGSYLGLKAAQDALAPAYYNEFRILRKKGPRIYFEGNNLDPETLSVLLKELNPKKTFVVVISKSGETTETKAAFAVVEEWLKKSAAKFYGRQILAITDPHSGALRKRVNAEQKKDLLSFRSLDLLPGVGGRYSELNMGLLHLAIIGVNLKEVLSGAKAMAKRCALAGLERNPAYMYAALQTVLYRRKNKSISILMPFSEGLKSTADWYCQLLAESTGKKYARKIRRDSAGREEWLSDAQKTVYLGRTPIATRGTNDLHSVQQNNVEGENNKTVTMIRIEDFKNDIKLGAEADFLGGKKYSRLLALAQEATQWALVRACRPNCTIIMPRLNPFHWGELIYFFELATAFEAELLQINGFDQPGVESYKNYMYYKLRKPGLAAGIARAVQKNPLVKKKRFII